MYVYIIFMLACVCTRTGSNICMSRALYLWLCCVRVCLTVSATIAINDDDDEDADNDDDKNLNAEMIVVPTGLNVICWLDSLEGIFFLFSVILVEAMGNKETASLQFCRDLLRASSSFLWLSLANSSFLIFFSLLVSLHYSASTVLAFSLDLLCHFRITELHLSRSFSLSLCFSHA